MTAPTAPRTEAERALRYALQNAYFAGWQACVYPNREDIGLEAAVNYAARADVSSLIDQHAAPELTAEQCVARLVELGIAKPNTWRLPNHVRGSTPTHYVYAPAPERAP